MAKHRSPNPTRSTRLQRHDRAVKAGKPCWDMECIKCKTPATANPHGQMPWVPKVAKPRGARKKKPMQEPVAPPQSPVPAIPPGLPADVLRALMNELKHSFGLAAHDRAWALREQLASIMSPVELEQTEAAYWNHHKALKVDDTVPTDEEVSRLVQAVRPAPEPIRQRTPPPILIEREPPKGVLSRIFGRKSGVYATPASWGAHKLFAQIAQKARTA